MKITELATYHVKPRWMFLKVSTDEGIDGWGEPIVEGRAKTVETAVHELGRYLVGEDPRDIERHWQTMYRGTFYRGGPVLVSALSGIEQALWDIKAKRLGVPVYELLGGAVRSRIRMYCHCGGDSPEEAAASVAAKRDAGFTAAKLSLDGPCREVGLNAFIDRHVERLAAVRDAVGNEVDVAIDFHGRVNPAAAIRLAKAFEPFGPMFIEEPCLPDNVDALVRVAQSTSIPIATGERLMTRWGFREVLEKQAAAIIQPDLCHAGGIFEVRKLAAMAETYYCAVAPHNPLGPISLAACIQLSACTPNFLILEHPSMAERWDLGEGYLKKPFEIKDGYIELPTAPGLGIEPDEDVIAERAFSGDWDTPRLAYPDDGSFAEW